MNRLATGITIALLVLAAVASVPILGEAQVTVVENDTAEPSAAPGALLVGAVGVQGAEFEGEMERRTFGISIARANSDAAQADVVKESLEISERRLTELEQRKEQLDRARETGSIENGTYHARMAVLVAQTRNVQSRLNASEKATAGLPTAVLERNGINASAIQTLKRNASELTGPEVAAIAKRIAGPDIGRSIANDRAPSSVGPPDRSRAANGESAAGNESDTGRSPGGIPDERGPDGPVDSGQGNGTDGASIDAEGD